MYDYEETIHVNLLICGGRDYKDQETLNRIMDDIVKHINPGYITVVSGHARGADKLGEIWAKSRDLSLALFPANWKRYGKSAGFKRNIEMLDLISVAPEDEYRDDHYSYVVAFPGGKGTAHTVHNAKKRGIHVMEVQGQGVKSVVTGW
jgi:hypothetical protein